MLTKSAVVGSWEKAGVEEGWRDKPMINLSLCFSGPLEAWAWQLQALRGSSRPSRSLPSLKHCLRTLLSSSSLLHPRSSFRSSGLCSFVFKVMQQRRRRARGEAGREGAWGADEETESRISSAMCQPAPVNVFIRIQYLWTHVYPPRRHPKATTHTHTEADLTSEKARIVTECFLFWAEQSLIQRMGMKKHEKKKQRS